MKNFNKKEELEDSNSSSEDKRYNDALEFYKLTIKIISMIIILLTFLIGALSIVSRIEVSDAVDKMEKKFNKEPIIEILYKGRALENQIIQISSTDSIYFLPKIELYNQGNGQTTYPSINLSLADSIKYLQTRRDLWLLDFRPDEYFKYYYQLNISSYDTPDLRVIFPHESDLLPDFKFIVPKDLDLIDCKLEVFYENDESSAVRFSLKIISIR